MQAGRFVFLLLVLLSCGSCSYEEKHRIEGIVERAVDKFHTQLNEGKYHEIYEQAYPELREKVTESYFVALLSSAHQQVGSSKGNAIVIIDDSIWRGLRRSLTSSETVPYASLIGGEVGIGWEKFSWMVEGNQARLSSYEFRFTCKKPCQVGFRLRD